MQEQQIIYQMVALSEKKLEMLLKIKELSEKQSKAFIEQRLDSIEATLNKKDEIIKYIHRLDDAFLKASNQLKEQLDIESLDALTHSSLDGRKELKALICEITATVEAIIRIEKDSHHSASEFKKELGNRIKDVSAGKKMATAYNVKPTSNPSYFFDRKN